MIRYKDVNDALEAFDKSSDAIKRMLEITRRDINDVKIIGPSMEGEFYNLMESLLWLCNYDDSDPNGTQPFVSLSDIPWLRTSMPLDRNVREAAKNICRGDRPDFKHLLTRNNLEEFLKSVLIFTEWIRKNARDQKIRISDYADRVLEILDIFPIYRGIDR